MVDTEILMKVCQAVAAASDRTIEPGPEQRLVDDLAFDSLRMTRLAVELEARLGRTVLINEWLALAPELSDLTVGSLSDYLRQCLSEDTGCSGMRRPSGGRT